MVKINTDSKAPLAAAKAILAMTGEDLTREGLERTPERFVRAYQHILSGYQSTADEVVGSGVFPAEGAGLVSVEDVEFYSMCEHHLLPFWGKAKVAYFPGKKILGLSKIPRLINLYARRVQVQERITEQLAESIVDLIKPRAVAVCMQAQHFCMMMRGVEKQASSTRTQKIVGFDDLLTWEQQQLLTILNR